MNLIIRSMLTVLAGVLRHTLHFLLACLVLLLTTVLLLTATPGGRVWLAEQGILIVNRSTDWHVQVAGVQSPGLTEWGARQVRLYPPDGRESAVNITDLRVGFPLNQWEVAYTIDYLSADQVTIDLERLQPFDPDPPADDTDGPPELPEDPGFGLWLDRLEIARLEIRDQRNGDPLVGSVSGEMAWSGSDDLPVFSLRWGEPAAPLLNLAGQPDPDGERWQLQGDVNLPPGSWAHSLAQWPRDTELIAHLALDVDLPAQHVVLHQVRLPWQGHEIIARGTIAHEAEGWTLNDAELQVDDHVSQLSGRLASGQSELTGAVDLPLTLIQPLLPEQIRDNSVLPGDRLAAQIEWYEDAPWTIDGQLTTHWHERPLSADLAAEGNALVVDQVNSELTLGDSRLTLAGQWNLRSQEGRLTLEAQLAEDIGAPYWSDPILNQVNLSGEIRGSGLDDDGSMRWPTWVGDLSANGLLAADTTLSDFPWEANAEARIEFPDFHWQGLTLAVDTGSDPATLRSSGQFDLSDQMLDVQWALDELPIAAIVGSLTDWPEDLTAMITGEGDIQGRLDDFNGTAQIEGYGLWHGQTWQAQLDAPLLSTRQVLVDSLTGEWQDSRVQASLSLRPDLSANWQSWPVQADISPLEIDLRDASSAVTGRPDTLTEGQVISSLSVRGALGDPDVLAQSRINARYLGESLNGSLNWQADNLQADFNWQGRQVSITGQGRPWDQGNWDIRADRIEIADLEPWMDLPENLLDTDLTSDLQLRVDGGLQDLSLILHSQHSGHWEGQALDGTNRAQLHWRDGAVRNWSVDGLDITWGDTSLSARAENRDDRLLPELFELTVDDFPVHLFLPVPDLDARASGTASLDADWPGWLLDVDMAVTGGRGDDVLDGAMRGGISGRDTELTQVEISEMMLTFGDHLALQGRGGFEDNVWDVDIRWNGLSWTPSDSMPFPATPWEGEGAIQLSGVGDDPDIDAFADWHTRWETADEDETLALAFSSQLRTTQDALTFTAGLRHPGKDLIVMGAETPRMPMSERLETSWTDWAFEAFWDIDLATDEALYWLGQEQFQVAGSLLGDGAASGTLGAPDVDGTLSWENGSLRLPQTGSDIDRINVTLSADNTQQLDVEGSGRAGDGSINIGGNLTLADGELVSDLALELDRAAVIQRRDIQSLASGSLQLTGAWPDLLLSGDLSLAQLTVNINRLAGPSAPQLEIHNEQDLNDLNGGIPLALDIVIRTDGNATIRGNGINAQMSGELRLGGTLDQLQSDGAMTIESGRVNLLTRNFTLQEGQLRLVDEALNINIVAVHQRPDVMIEATITGNAEQLELHLRSEPALPEDEIVAQLLFGKSVRNMTPWQALQLASAVNQLGGGDSVDLFQTTRETLGLDRLEVEGPEAEGDAATLTVGRYLNSRVYLEVDQELGNERDWQGSVEIELTPNLNLETFTGSGGGSGGLELRWRRDY